MAQNSTISSRSRVLSATGFALSIFLAPIGVIVCLYGLLGRDRRPRAVREHFSSLAW